jgi:anti-sigma regulatory factor (Ser/Thr protein kinase)
MIFSRHLMIQNLSHIGEARRLGTYFCHDMGFEENQIAKVALIITELATNLIKHTNGLGGELVFRQVTEDSGIGIDILALDRGPGISHIGKALEGGQSTSGSYGSGIPAIIRLSSLFDIFSVIGRGTAVFCRLWKTGMAPITNKLAMGAVCLAVHGEEECGDAWAMKAGFESRLIMLADGLGHGPDAAVASNLAVSIFLNGHSQNPIELMQLIHAGLSKTRGAVVAVVEIKLDLREIRYVGVGNITGQIFVGDKSHFMVSQNGTVGCEARKIQEFSYPYPPGALLVLYSDGLATHWKLADYPGLALKHPALIAGVLFRDHRRPKDDSTVVVVR